MPQELMAMFPKKVWAVTTGDRKESFPSWTVKNKDSDSRQLLPKEQWEYFCDVDHSAMCEILETHVTNKTYQVNQEEVYISFKNASKYVAAVLPMGYFTNENTYTFEKWVNEHAELVLRVDMPAEV